MLVSWEADDKEPDCVALTVRATDEPLAWVGDGAGEKGLARFDESKARRNMNLVIGPITYFSRICWNSKGWICATGDSRGLETPPRFVTSHGFGHEEWLFNNLWEIEGWRYGFLQPVNASWSNHQGEIIHVGLYTIDPSRRRLWAGPIRRAEVLTEAEAPPRSGCAASPPRNDWPV